MFFLLNVKFNFCYLELEACQAPTQLSKIIFEFEFEYFHEISYLTLVLFVDVIVSAPGAQLAAFLDRSKKGRPSQKRVNNIDL